MSKLQSEVECRQDLEKRLSELSLEHNQATLHVESYDTECKSLRNIVEQLISEKESMCKLIRQDQVDMETLRGQVENYEKTMGTLKEGLHETQLLFSKTEKQNAQLQDKAIGVVTVYDSLFG